MAGPTAKNYNVQAIRQGPGDLWVIGTPPTDTTVRLTLDAGGSGTPDITAHPQSVCFGLTKGGITVEVKSKLSSITVDQADGPVDAYVETVGMSIEVELSQQNIDIMQNVLTTSAYSTVVSPGYKQLTVGGISIVPTAAIAVITPLRYGSGLFQVALLYQANMGGLLSFMHSRSKQSSTKVTFEGQSVLARTAGKQIGVIYETL